MAKSWTNLISKHDQIPLFSKKIATNDQWRNSSCVWWGLSTTWKSQAMEERIQMCSHKCMSSNNRELWENLIMALLYNILHNIMHASKVANGISTLLKPFNQQISKECAQNILDLYDIYEKTSLWVRFL